MVRISKKSEKRSRSHRKTQKPALKTGAKKCNLPSGFVVRENALTGEAAVMAYIPKIK